MSLAVMAFSRRRWQPRSKIEDEDEFEDEEKGASLLQTGAI
jgi:hypothetical protein